MNYDSKNVFSRWGTLIGSFNVSSYNVLTLVQCIFCTVKTTGFCAIFVLYFNVMDAFSAVKHGFIHRKCMYQVWTIAIVSYFHIFFSLVCLLLYKISFLIIAKDFLSVRKYCCYISFAIILLFKMIK